MEQQPKRSRSWFPSDLTSEILLRLPVKSVRRFRCVSKLWLSITTDPCFIKSFGSARPNFLLCSIKRGNSFVTSSTTQQHTRQSSIRSYSSSQPIHRHPMNLPGEHCYFSRMDSVYGLICLKDADTKKPLVWNPSTDQLLLLPKPNMSWRQANVFLGYDPVERKHKVVCLPYKKTCHVCRVFILGSGQESWRTVKTNLKHRCCGSASGLCINGVIYYIARNIQSYDTVIMSFDVRSELFHMIEHSSDINQDVLISYEGRLACIDRYKNTRLCVLEDADKHKWSFQDFIVPLNKWNLNVPREEDNWDVTATAPYRDHLYNRFELKGCTHAGEFIYVPCRFHKFSYIVLYDPVRNSCRRLKFEGIVDELNMHAFPNHIESLMSL